MPDDRRPRTFHDRPQQGPPGGRPPYVPRPPGPSGPPRSGFAGSRPGGPQLDAPVSVRLREGDREVEVHGSPAFCRQLLDDLPVVLARLRGEGGRTAAIALPRPAETTAPPPAAVTPVAHHVAPATAAGEANGHAAAGVDPSTALDEAVVAALRGARKPITIAELRRRLPEQVSGQAVRRVLERAGDRIVNVGGKPAAYRAR